MTDAGGAPTRREKVLICDCEGTMALDRKVLEGGFAEGCAKAGFTQLCRGELGRFIDEARGAAGLTVACTQEIQTFQGALAGSGTASRRSRGFFHTSWNCCGARPLGIRPPRRP